MSRRPILAVIGNGGPVEPVVESLCRELGRRAVDRGFRLVTGGLGGVMAAASRGAHESARYREGDVLGVLPSADRDAANPWVDIAIPTGMGVARNALVVATADVVVAVGGGAGTLSELALGWQLERPIVALSCVEGWARRLAGTAVDERRRAAVLEAADAATAIDLAQQALGG